MKAFKTYAASVIGASHLKNNRPNQDAYGIGKGYMIVSDGHGGKEHALSHEGARLAVVVAERIMADILKVFATENSEPKRMAYLENELSFALQNKWREAVIEHYQASLEPLMEEEDIWRLYGCTLLMVFEFEARFYCLQIGDGTIVYLDALGVHFPIHDDHRLQMGMTTSMCDQYPWLSMRTGSFEKTQTLFMVGLFTDGVESAHPGGLEDEATYYVNLALNCFNTPATFNFESELMLASHYSKDDTTGTMWFDNEVEANNLLVFEAMNWEVFTNKLPKGYELLSTKLSSLSLHKRVELARMWWDRYHRDKGMPIGTVKSWLVSMTDDHVKPFKVIEESVGVSEFLNTFITCQPGDTEDLKGLLGKIDTLQRQTTLCYHCGTYHFQKTEMCIKCHQDLSFHVKLVSGGKAYSLFHDSTVRLHQIIELSGHYNPLVGKIVQHPKHPNVWGLQNLTHHAWIKDGEKIQPGKTMTLLHNQTVYIYGLPVHIRFH